MDEADPLLVDGDEEELGVVGVRGLLDLEEGRAEGRPPVDDLEEGDLGVLGAHAGVVVVALDDLPLPVLRAHLLDQVGGHELAEHLGEGLQLDLGLAELDPVDEGGQHAALVPGALVVAWKNKLDLKSCTCALSRFKSENKSQNISSIACAVEK